MSCADEYMRNPKHQAHCLAEALQKLWTINIDGCPCEWPLDRRLAVAENNVIHGRVDMVRAQPDTYGPNAFSSPEHLLNWLKENKPSETPVLTHGDFCLPNILFTANGLSGYIDLGRSGTADKWQDIALCCRSLLNNYNGSYSGRKFEGFEKQMFFDALGVQPEMELIRYYILLDELF